MCIIICSPDGSSVSLLGGGTAVLSGLSARLCHAFLVLNMNCDILTHYNACMPNKGWFANFGLKLVTMAMSVS